MIFHGDNTRDDLVQQAAQVLVLGKGHLGVINMLTTLGFDNDKASIISHEIFEDAKLHMRRLQFHVRCIAWALIFAGPIASITLTLLNVIDEDHAKQLWLISGIPIFYGIRTLSKLPNPSQLQK